MKIRQSGQFYLEYSLILTVKESKSNYSAAPTNS